MFININGTEIRGIFIHTNQYLTNFVIVLANSVITNRSKIHFYPPLEINGVKKDYVRQLRMTKCSLNNSNFHIIYASANVVIEDSIIINMLPMVLQSGIHIYHSNLTIINGGSGVSFSNVSNGANPSSFISAIGSNVTIAGHIAFSNNKITPISSYSSTITLSGNVTFLNNSGVNGGAMALYSSTLNIAGNTSMYFYNNTATDTTGAIYVTRTIIKQTNFIYIQTRCFYQLLDYTDYAWYHIEFQGNRAKNGGDHIYGEYMHSDICSVSEIEVNIYQRLSSYMVQQNYFVYEPDVNLTLSSISSNPTCVCLCDSGLPRSD